MAIVTTGGLVDIPPASTALPPGQWAVAAGIADTITAAYPTPNLTLPDGLLLAFRALLANATTTPTFAPDNLPAHVITKHGGSALAANDILPLMEVLVRYNLANTRWEVVRGF